MAAPGEACYQPPKPWDDPPAAWGNTSNLPMCPPRLDERRLFLFDGGGVQLLGGPDYGTFRFPSDAGLFMTHD